MLPMEHSALLLTFIKIPVIIKTFVLSIFEWLFYTGFTVSAKVNSHREHRWWIMMSVLSVVEERGGTVIE